MCLLYALFAWQRKSQKRRMARRCSCVRQACHTVCFACGLKETTHPLMSSCPVRFNMAGVCGRRHHFHVAAERPRACRSGQRRTERGCSTPSTSPGRRTTCCQSSCCLMRNSTVSAAASPSSATLSTRSQGVAHEPRHRSPASAAFPSDHGQRSSVWYHVVPCGTMESPNMRHGSSLVCDTSLISLRAGSTGRRITTGLGVFGARSWQVSTSGHGPPDLGEH